MLTNKVKVSLAALSLVLAVVGGVWYTLNQPIVIKRGELTITLTKQACQVPNVQAILHNIGAEQYMGSKMLSGHAKDASSEADLCYFVVKGDENQIFVIDADGGMGFLLLDPTKPVKKS